MVIRIFLLLCILSSLASAQTILWGATSGFQFDSHVVLNDGNFVYVAALQPTVATVIVESSTAPSVPLVSSKDTWVTITPLNANIGNNYYYDITIPQSQQSPVSSRVGTLEIVNRGTTYTAKFVQTSAGIEVVDGASYSLIKKRAGAILSIFGRNLSFAQTSATSLPLPTNLADTRVYTTYKSSSSATSILPEQCQLFFVSPSQINFIQSPTPTPTIFSNVTYWVIGSAGAYSKLSQTADSLGNFNESPIASIFSQTQTGDGVPASFIQVCEGSDCTNEYFTPSRQTPSSFLIEGFNYEPLLLNRQNKDIYLNLYTTGLRKNNNTFPSLKDIEVVIDGATVNPIYAGESGFAGVEQVQILIPKQLATGVARIISLKIKTKYNADSWYNGDLEWASLIRTNGLTGDIRNNIRFPIK